MHFIGLFFAIPAAWLIKGKFLKGKSVPFTLELPRVQWPKWRDVVVLVITRGKVFLKTAGTIIFVLSIVIWALSYFPHAGEDDPRFKAEYSKLTPDRTEDLSYSSFVSQRQREESYLGQAGRAIEPVFRPAGFDWRISTAILAAFPAREVVVPALGILFGLGSDTDEGSTDLRDAMVDAQWPDGRPLFTLWNSMGLMVFFALCAQCMATLAAIKREAGSWKWAGWAFVYMTSLAYICAVAINQIGAAVGG
jgi:ferrous iron transport protein B